MTVQDTRRHWSDLSEDEQRRVTRLLKPDLDDNLDDLLARMRRAAQIIEGTEPARIANERAAFSTAREALRRLFDATAAVNMETPEGTHEFTQARNAAWDVLKARLGENE